MDRMLEYGLRAALHPAQGSLDLINPAAQAKELEARINTFASTLNGTQKMQLTAAGMTIVGLGVAAYEAYSIIEKRLTEAHAEEEAFLEMIDKGVSTYFIPRSKKVRAKCDNYVHAFITLLSEDPVLYSYAGLYTKDLDHGEKKGKVYAVMSKFDISLNGYFEKVEDDLEGLAQARQRLNIFLTSLKTFLKQINKTVDLNNLISKVNRFAIVGTAQDLTQINATRFLVIVFGNILINLVAPTDPNTREPLSFAQSAEHCQLFHGLINKMRSHSMASFHDNVSSLKCAEEFDEFLLRLSEKVLALQIAYRITAKDEPNLNEVSTNTHLLLRSLNFSLRDFIYKSNRLETNLKENVIDLSLLVHNSPTLIEDLRQHLLFREPFNYQAAGLNDPPKTAMDVLTLWSEASPKKRALALKNLKKENDQQKQFVKLLQTIELHFITPIEAIDIDPSSLLNREQTNLSLITNAFTSVTRTKKRSKSAAQLYLMSFIAMELAVDSVIFKSEEDATLRSEKQQILVLLERAIDENARYGFGLLKKLPLPESIISALMTMMRARFQILPLLLQLDEMFSYLQSNKSMLDDEETRDFLVPRLELLQIQIGELVDTVESLVEAAEGVTGSNASDLLNILAGLNAPHANMLRLSIPNIVTGVRLAIQHSIDILKDIQFDERMEKKEHAQIQFIQLAGCRQDATLGAEAKAIYAIMQPRRSWKSLVATSTSTAPAPAASASILLPPVSAVPPVSPTIMPSAAGRPAAPIAAAPASKQTTPSYFFMLQAFTWLARISVALLLIGFCAMMFMAFGAHSIPIIASLSAPVASGIMISGLVSAAAGGLGLVAAYYTPRLFKPAASPSGATRAQENLELSSI